MLAVGVLALILLVSGFPEAENPVPDRIGPDVIFTAAGFGGVVAGIAFFGAPEPRRESAIRWGGLIGFFCGALLYLVALGQSGSLTLMKPFVLDRRDKVKIGAIVFLGIGVILAGEFVTNLVYLPVYALIAAAFLWQRLHGGSRVKARSDATRSTGSR